MPFERDMGIYHDPIRWDNGDWFSCASAANCTAAQQMVASAGAGNRHYISSISITTPSAQTISIQDGASTVIKRMRTTAGGETNWSLPRGMEYRCPTAGQKIMIKSDVSASTYWTIAGFYKPYIA